MKRKKEESVEGAVLPKKADVKVIDKSKREKFHQSLYRPPTNEEINELKETETLYKDSLFRMQMKCLLDEVKINPEDQAELDKILHSLHTSLDSMKDWEEMQSLSDLSWLPSNIKFPMYSEEERIVQGNFQFKKPASIKVIGSFLLKTCASPRPSVDIAVEMPTDCFHKKDYLNFRYHTKRALYLSVLASHLSSWDGASEIYFIRPRRNMKKPALALECRGASGKMFTVRIFPALDKDTFKLTRFLPHQNNVRSSWVNGNSDTQDEVGPATPLYNASILEDILYEQHLHYLYNCVKSCPGMVDAIILLKLWLYQRGFYEDCCSFNGFVGSMVMAYLLSVRQVTRHMSSYQIFRVTLQFIATSKWSDIGLSMISDDPTGKCPSLIEMKAAYDVALVDPSGYFNLCHGLSTADYQHLIFEASETIQILDRKHIDSFDALFVQKVCFAEKFDHCFRLPSFTSIPGCKASTVKSVDEIGDDDWPSRITDDVIRLLRKGLGNRISCLCAKPLTPHKWDISEAPQGSAMNEVLFGLILNSEGYDRIMEKGPAADSPEASEFSSFWGGKAELRRFKDGSISSAVVWEVKSLADRMVVIKQVVNYLLQKFFKIPSEEVVYSCNQLNILLQPRIQENKLSKTNLNGTNYEEQQRICEIFETLAKDIRKLSGLPLQVNSVQGTSPVLRLTEVFAPRLSAKKRKLGKIVKNRYGAYEKPSYDGKLNIWTPAIEVCLQFETSGRWPNDLSVVQHLKAAFYIKLADLLKKQCNIASLVSPKYLDIFKGGHIFRLRIFHFREITLLKEDTTAGPEKKEYLQRAKELDRSMIKLPLHSTMIHGLGHRFPGFRDTVRLAKRWVSAQLLGDYLTEEAIELIVSSLYLTPAPYAPSISYQSGFLRFLRLLSTFDWKNIPLVVDLNSSLKDEDYEEISEHFLRNRSSLPPIFIATPYDKTTSIWTTPQPDAQILRRLVFLASESRKKLENKLVLGNLESAKELFRPSLGDFDVVIILNRENLPRHYQAVDTSFLVRPPSLQAAVSDVIPTTNFDPASCYLKELKSSFSDYAHFFHDIFGGFAIGVLWKTKEFVPQPVKVFHSHYRTVISNAGDSNGILAVPDVASILADFQMLGEGLVKEVKVVRSFDC